MENKEISELAKAAKDGKIEVTILKGDAPKFLDPIKPIVKKELKIEDSIGTISEFLSKRNHLFKCDECHIQVKENKMIFFGNECSNNDEHITEVSGELLFSKEFKNLSLNSGEDFESKELARYLRKRQNLFVDKEQFKTVWVAMSQFKAAIDKKIESSDDRSGNIRASIQQDVVHNIPKTFQLSMPVFENQQKLTFEVEVDVNPHDLNCSLMSFDIDEKIEEQRKQLIENELEQEIKESLKLQDFCVVYKC